MNRFNTHSLSVGIVSALIVAIAPPGYAVDNEPNDSYGDRNVLPSNTTTVQGELTNRFDPDEFDYTFSGTMTPGRAESFEIENLIPIEPFFAWIDNGTTGPDTVMGILNQDGIFLSSDDDGSPVGNGVASGLGGVVNPDGTIRLAVSGFPDFDFAGLKTEDANIHQERGSFEVRVRLGTDVPQSDVDFYTFTELTPGSAFTVEITEASFDTTLAWLDDDGEIIYTDDDGGQELLSRIRGYVPLSGNVTLAITAFGDVEFSGQHLESGTYTFILTQP